MSKPIIIDGVLHEMQWQHNYRLEREARQLERAKVLSRSRANQPGRRLRLTKRAKGACEICSFRLSAILNLHHIYPVRLGGAASDRNLVVICPNCHGVVHFLAKVKLPVLIARRIERLKAAGYTDMQVELIRLIASHDAHVLPDGTIEPYTDPEPIPFIIVDGPDADPEALARYEAAEEARNQRAIARSRDSHVERGRRIVEAMRATQSTGEN